MANLKLKRAIIDFLLMTAFAAYSMLLIVFGAWVALVADTAMGGILRHFFLVVWPQLFGG